MQIVNAPDHLAFENQLLVDFRSARRANQENYKAVIICLI